MGLAIIPTRSSFRSFNMSTAYLLLSHGSRDPRPQESIDRLCDLLAVQLGDRSIGSASLELAADPLSTQIINFLATQNRQIDRLIILPLFLLPGVHMMEDIPAEITIARAQIAPTTAIELIPYIGSQSQIIDLLKSQCQQLPQDILLLSHGSKRSGGNEPTIAIATKLGIDPVYWSIDPSLADGVKNLADRGVRSIGILPYFLFPGGITDAIADRVAQLRQEYPNLTLTLGHSIGLDNQFSEIIRNIFANLEVGNS
jgi:sirohydrochlorin cobaltochelatase